MSVPEQTEQWVWLARIRRPQGRKGEVFADILTDFPEKFADRRRLWLLAAPVTASPDRVRPDSTRPDSTSPRAASPARSAPIEVPCEAELINHWLHKGGVVLHFAGVDSISAAEELAGLIVALPRAQRAGLAEDEVYIGDLVGCVLADVSGMAPAGAGNANACGVEVGEIVDVDRTAGPVPLLLIDGANGEVLIPFAKDYLRRIDIENKRVEMALPGGLADLNAPEKQ